MSISVYVGSYGAGTDGGFLFTAAYSKWQYMEGDKRRIFLPGFCLSSKLSLILSDVLQSNYEKRFMYIFQAILNLEVVTLIY